MNVTHRTNASRFAAPSRAAVLVFALALASGLALRPAGAHPTHPEPAAPAVIAPASTPAPAAAPAPTSAAANVKAVPDSLTRLEADVRRDSTNARKQYRLGVAYLDLDRASDAVGRFQKAVSVKPDFLEAWVNLGAAQDAVGHGAEARAAYRRALALKSDDEIALCRLASSYYATGQRDSAMAVLRETIGKNPRSHCSYFTLGVSYADAGMFREAIRSWERVVEYAPTSPEAESARESIKLLKDYMGSDSTATAAGAGPVPPGAGGPSEVLPGGDMKSFDMKGAAGKDAAKVESKPAPKSGGK